jgi:hypothetical protein
LGLHKGRPSYRRSLQALKRTSSTLKDEILTVFYFCRSFSSSWIPIRTENPDPAPVTTLNPDPVTPFNPDPDMDPDPDPQHCFSVQTPLMEHGEGTKPSVPGGYCTVKHLPYSLPFRMLAVEHHRFSQTKSFASLVLSTVLSILVKGRCFFIFTYYLIIISREKVTF